MGCPTTRPANDGGAGRFDAGLSVGGDSGVLVDAGVTKGPSKHLPPPNWLDGGGSVAVRAVWEPALRAQSLCSVTQSGRLFLATESLAEPGMLRMVFATPDASISVNPERPLGLVQDDESFYWCDINLPAPQPVRCQRKRLDGGIILSPGRFFDITSWTATGFISGAVRKVEPGRWRNVWLPDGGVWDYPVDVLFHESGLGTGQFQPLDGGLEVAFLWDDGELFILEPPESRESSWGQAVNGAGLVVGERFVGGANAGAVFWGNETATLPRRRGYSADLRGVNESGLAVGQERGNRGEWAVIWYRGTTWYLDDLVDAGVGCNYTNAESVNDRNIIAATRECADRTRRCARIELSVDP